MDIQFSGRTMYPNMRAFQDELMRSKRFNVGSLAIERMDDANARLIELNNEGVAHLDAFDGMMARFVGAQIQAGEHSEIQERLHKVGTQLFEDFYNSAILNTQAEVDEYVARFPSEQDLLKSQ